MPHKNRPKRVQHKAYDRAYLRVLRVQLGLGADAGRVVVVGGRGARVPPARALRLPATLTSFTHAIRLRGPRAIGGIPGKRNTFTAVHQLHVLRTIYAKNERLPSIEIKICS